MLHPLATWSDEAEFLAADPARRRSDEVDLGARWRDSGSVDTWRLAWLRDTGELYACRADSLLGACTDVVLLAVLARETELDAALAGWRDAERSDAGLSWLDARLSGVMAA